MFCASSNDSTTQCGAILADGLHTKKTKDELPCAPTAKFPPSRTPMIIAFPDKLLLGPYYA